MKVLATLAAAMVLSACSVEIPVGDKPVTDNGWPTAGRATRLNDAHYAYCRSGDLAVKVDLSKSDLAVPVVKGAAVQVKANAQSGFQKMAVSLETQGIVDGATQVTLMLDAAEKPAVILETKDGVDGSFWYVVGGTYTGGACRFYAEGI